MPSRGERARRCRSYRGPGADVLRAGSGRTRSGPICDCVATSMTGALLTACQRPDLWVSLCRMKQELGRLAQLAQLLGWAVSRRARTSSAEHPHQSTHPPLMTRPEPRPRPGPPSSEPQPRPGPPAPSRFVSEPRRRPGPPRTEPLPPERTPAPEGVIRPEPRPPPQTARARAHAQHPERDRAFRVVKDS